MGQGEVEAGQGEVEVGQGEVEAGQGEVEAGQGEVEVGQLTNPHQHAGCLHNKLQHRPFQVVHGLEAVQ